MDSTDRRYHILKNTSTSKYFKAKNICDEIRAEKSYQVSANGVWEQQIKSEESGAPT